MVFRLIEKGTRFNIESSAKNSESGVRMIGSLYEPANDIVLLIEGDDLYEYCAALTSVAVFTVQFQRGSKEYTFEAKFERVLTINNVKLTEVIAVSMISVGPRRSTWRFGMMLDVNIYTKNENEDTNPDFTGQTYDISCDSIGIWSNGEILNTNGRYNISFSLRTRDSFRIPAKLLRKKPAPKISLYKYDYVFIFEYTDDQRTKTRLLDSLIKSNLNLSK